jgi:hypothetical protein
MSERKLLMGDLSDAFLALPGGIGTMDELFEAWTGRSSACIASRARCSTRTVTTTRCSRFSIAQWTGIPAAALPRALLVATDFETALHSLAAAAS